MIPGLTRDAIRNQSLIESKSGYLKSKDLDESMITTELIRAALTFGQFKFDQQKHGSKIKVLFERPEHFRI